MSLTYEVRPRGPHGSGVDLISDNLPFGKLWYGEPGAIDNAASYAEFNAGGGTATITIFDKHGRVIETRTHIPEARKRAHTRGAL